MNTVERLEKLIALSIALSTETNANLLLEKILDGAMELSKADAGTIYIKTADNYLRFGVIKNNSLNLASTNGKLENIHLSAIPLYNADGRPNERLVAAYCAINEKVVNIEDVYATKEFDFSGTRRYDTFIGYRSKSFLTLPLKNHEQEVVGVLQLINALDDRGEIISFSDEDQILIESLASLAAVTLNKQQLIDAQKALFESFIQLIAQAIDEKSSHTGAHCERVPAVAMMLAEAVCQTQYELLKDYSFTEEELYELKIAAWLHDCGKITTPEWVINKSTKLETITDRIQLIDARYEVLKRDAVIELLNAQITTLKNREKLDEQALFETYSSRTRQLEEDLDFLRRANIGSEFMTQGDVDRVADIARQHWIDSTGKERPLLTMDEVYNLSIRRGTLTREERNIINNHIDVTIKMLESLNYPRNLQHVPEIAGGHHEHMDGSGYPKGLTGEQMSLRARIMAVADVFEALTSSDRPYKTAKILSETLSIMAAMVRNGKLDGLLFEVFIREKVYLRFAKAYMKPEQMDTVDDEYFLALAAGMLTESRQC